MFPLRCSVRTAQALPGRWLAGGRRGLAAIPRPSRPNAAHRLVVTGAAVLTAAAGGITALAVKAAWESQAAAAVPVLHAAAPGTSEPATATATSSLPCDPTIHGRMAEFIEELQASICAEIEAVEGPLGGCGRGAHHPSQSPGI